MTSEIDSDTELVQYADHTFTFAASDSIEKAIELHEQNIRNLIIFFAKHKLNVNPDKSEVYCFQ